jgi:hypothetical protein
MHTPHLARRALVTVAAVAGAATLTVAGVSAAQDATSRPSRAAVAQPGGIQARIEQALTHLVRSGAITQHQADVVEGRARSGSIDPKQLVNSGVVSNAEMRIVADALDRVKAAG